MRKQMLRGNENWLTLISLLWSMLVLAVLLPEWINQKWLEEISNFEITFHTFKGYISNINKQMLRGRGTFFTLINAGTVSIVTSMDKKKIIGQNRQFSNYDIQYENNFQLIPYNYGVNLTKTGSNDWTRRMIRNVNKHTWIWGGGSWVKSRVTSWVKNVGKKKMLLSPL